MNRLWQKQGVLNLCKRFTSLKRWQSSVVEKTLQYKSGDKLHGYTVKKVASVPEFHLAMVELHHEGTGAQHLHLARDDTDNMFGVAFRTTPMDSTGVPHILEHTALCGSEKFPVRDPFFKMLNRSLSTFMNAFTASDWTMYPFSTQNPQDFRNLLSIYLDAVFFPRLRETDFMQEGWRLEHENPADPSSPITFKGIVFNEMKGVFSNSQSLFAQNVQNKLLPNHTYSVVSGGDPLAIPDLTWQQLKDFHSSHYHPSNSKFFTYGSFPLEEHLQFINKNALENFSAIETNTQVPLEPRWSQSREASISCRPDPMSPDPAKQTTVALSCVLTSVTDIFEAFTLNIISTLLVQGDTSPFYQSLLEANIGSDYSPVLGYDGNTREGTFSVGLQGIHEEDEEKVRNIINQTLDHVIEAGFEEERIEALLHSIELGLKHETAHFGLKLSMGLIGSWIHDGSPDEALQVKAQVDKFTECRKNNPRFLQDKVEQYFKSNPHKLWLKMSPDEEFESKQQAEEKHKLDALVDNLTEAQRKEVYEKGLELNQLQSAQEDLSCLPTLTVSDLNPKINTVKTETLHADGLPIQYSAQPTNGVTYFRAISSTADLPEDLRPYLTLFASVVTKMGAGAMDFKELSQQIELKTGGLSAGTLTSDHHSDTTAYEQGVLFSSYCLDRNLPDMYHLWSEIFHSLDLSDMNRLTTLVRMTAADMAASLAGRGHAYAMGHSAGRVNPAARLREIQGGMSQVSLMKSIAEMEDLTPVVKNIQAIAAHVLKREHMRCAVNSSPEVADQVIRDSEKFLVSLPGNFKGLPTFTEEKNFSPVSEQTHFELPFDVHYMAKSYPTVPYTHADYASLRVLAKLMSSKYLHKEIREKGGAYGSGAAGSPGVFNFFSYRDPRCLDTLQVFDDAVTWARDGSFSQQDIDEAKLGIFQQLDAPIPPGSRGVTLFLSGTTDEMRQTHRDQLFTVTKEDIIRVAQKYLLAESSVSSVSFLGPRNEQVQSDSSWTIKTS